MASSNYYNEYKEIQELRKLWTDSINKWNQIFIPLSFAVFSIFLALIPDFLKEEDNMKYFIVLIIGGILLSSFLGFWRKNCHRIDKEIVAFYPRLLELEKNLNFDLQSSYFFRHLSKSSKEILIKKLGKKIEDLEKWDYTKFKRIVTEKNINPKDLLLEIWESNHYYSVGSRGHDSHDLFAIVLSSGYFIFILLIWIYSLQ